MKHLTLALTLAGALAASGCSKKKQADPEPAPGSGSTAAGTAAVEQPPLGSAAAGSGSAGSGSAADGSAGDIARELEKLEVDYAAVDKQIEETITLVENAKSDAERTTANTKLDELMKAQKDLADRRIVLRAKKP